MINQENQIDIYSKLTGILKSKFSEYQKHQIKTDVRSLRFACPYCGDSQTKLSAKRGNLYFDTGFFQCFNCGQRQTIINFLKRFNQEVSTGLFVDIKKVNNEQTKKSLSGYNHDIIEIQKYGINKRELMKKLGLKPTYKEHPFISERLLNHRINNIAFKGNDIYLFNLIDDSVIGYQVKKHFKNGSIYQKYNMSKMYDEVIKKTVDENIKEYDKLSLVYNFFEVDFSYPVTIFEGPIDSWFLRNSICSSSVNVKLPFLEENKNTRFFYDNDSIGKKKMIEKLEQGKKVFMWESFIDDFTIDVYLKDLNDIVKHFYKIGKIKQLEKLDMYFTNNIYDSIFI